MLLVRYRRARTSNGFAPITWPVSREGLENVLCPDFEFLTGLSILALDGRLPVGRHADRRRHVARLDRATRLVRDNIETIFRAGCAFFFIAIWGVGGILLTPELKPTSALVGAIQLGIAAGMLSRRTMPLSALGIFVLFDIGVWNYGAFHLADYPMFLGVAAYLALTGAAERFLRRASDRRVALGRRHHFDVGFDREMGLSGMVVSRSSSSIRR